VEFKAPLVVAPPPTISYDELKEGDWEILQNIQVSDLMIMYLKGGTYFMKNVVFRTSRM
jgi:aconitase B